MMNIRRKTICILVALFVWTSLDAQRVRLYEDVAHELAIRNTSFGPNKTHYTHLFLFAGQTFGASSDSLPINYFGSESFGLGFRYKNKIVGWWAHGLELGYNYQSYSIKQSDEKSFIDAEKYKKERLNLHQLQSAYFWRFRIGRAGNYLGRYVDLGVYGAWTFANTHKWVQTSDVSDAKRMVSKRKGVSYLESTEYGALGRIGFNKVAFFGKYRLSELLKPEDDNQPKLPPLTIGLELKI